MIREIKRLIQPARSIERAGARLIREMRHVLPDLLLYADHYEQPAATDKARFSSAFFTSLRA